MKKKIDIRFGEIGDEDLAKDEPWFEEEYRKKPYQHSCMFLNNKQIYSPH